MKTFITVSFSIAFTLASIFSSAKGNEAKSAPQAPQSFKVSMYKSAPKSLNLIVLKNTSDNLKIVIKDSNGEVVLRKNTKGIESFKQKFDFSKMELGAYTLEVKKGCEVYSSEFNID